MSLRADTDGLCIQTLKKRREFLLISDKGKRFITGTCIMQMLEQSESIRQTAASSPVRIGYTVTKKMGNAVTRNFIKRRLREATRRIAPMHAPRGYDYVLISRHKAVNCTFPDLLRDLEFAFTRILSSKPAVFSTPIKPARKRS